MSKCPIYQDFLNALPPVTYKELTKPRPYFIKLRDGRVYIPSETEMAVIDFCERYSKTLVLKKTYKPVRIQCPKLDTGDCKSNQ